MNKVADPCRPIAFQPASVLFETSNHAELLEKKGVRTMIAGTIDELLTIARAQGCSFPENFREQTMETMIQPAESPSLMYQDFTARRPMEIETFLGSPINLAKDVGVASPRIETLYALLHNANLVNQKRPQQTTPPSPQVGVGAGLPPRMSSAIPPHASGPVNGHGPMNGPMNGYPNGHMNGQMNGQMNGPGRPNMRQGSRAPSVSGMQPPMPPNMRRGPPSQGNGYPPRMNGQGPFPPRGQPMTRRPSMDGNDLEEFSHLMLYDNLPEGQLPEQGGYYDGAPPPPSSGGLALRERELAIRQRELALREQEMNMRGGGRRMPPPPMARGGYDDDDDDDGDYFDPNDAPQRGPPIDADNFDMMSVTSRRTRKAPSAQQLRNNPEMMGDGRKSRNPFSRPKQNRTSARLMGDMPGLHQDIMANSLMGYSSDRYGNVDRHNLAAESRSNSLTAERLNELQSGGPSPYGPPMPPSRRASQSPGNPLSPRPLQHRSPSGYEGPMPPRNGRPSPPGMRAPIPRHPPGHGNAVAPQQVEQQVGVSNHYPPNKARPQERSLTGSASASAGSGDSAHSARIDSDPSAHSSSSSLGPRPPIGVR